MFFEYGDEATNYLKARDRKLGAVIEQIGHIYRPVDTDLFSSVIHHIIGQQISTKAQQTIWQRLTDRYGQVDPEPIADASEDELQSLGMTFRKASYIKDFSEKVISGEFDLTIRHTIVEAVGKHTDFGFGIEFFDLLGNIFSKVIHTVGQNKVTAVFGAFGILAILSFTVGTFAETITVIRRNRLNTFTFGGGEFFSDDPAHIRI